MISVILYTTQRKETFRMEPQQPFNNPLPSQPEQPTPAEQPVQPLQPEQPVQPVQPVVTAPAAATTPAAAPAAVTQPVKKGLAIAALILAIVSVVLSLFWFIAAPLAIAAIIMAIVSLVKKRGGKGMSIAGLIVGGVALLIFIPIGIAITLQAYKGITEKAQNQAQVLQSQSTTSN